MLGICSVIFWAVPKGHMPWRAVWPAQLRETAFAITAIYGVLHLWSMRFQRALALDPRPEAAVMAHMMRDPRRLTTLDLAAFWLLVAIVTTCFIHPGMPPGAPAP